MSSLPRPTTAALRSFAAVAGPAWLLACAPQAPPALPTPPAPSMAVAPTPSAPSPPETAIVAPAQSGSPAVPSVYPQLDAEAETERRAAAERLLAGGVSLPDDAPPNPRHVRVTLHREAGGPDGSALPLAGIEETRCRHRLLPKPPKEMTFTVTVDANGIVTAAKVAALGSAKAFAACAEEALRTQREKLPPGEHKGTFSFDNVP
jgi:hypothetical protein